MKRVLSASIFTYLNSEQYVSGNRSRLSSVGHDKGTVNMITLVSFWISICLAWKWTGYFKKELKAGKKAEGVLISLSQEFVGR